MRMILWLALGVVASPIARADAAGAPAGPVATDIFDAFPASETTLPANGRVVLFGPPIFGLSIVRIAGDGTETPLAFEDVGAGNTHVYVITNETLAASPGGFAPGSSVVVASRCNSGCDFTASWTVDAALDTDLPTFGDGQAVETVTPVQESGITPDVIGFDVSISLPGVSDDGGRGAFVLASGEGVVAHRVQTAPGFVRLDLFVPGGEDRTACFDIVAFDAAGNQDEYLGFCTDLDPDDAAAGCAQSSRSPLPTTVVFALLALLSLRAVRRRARAMSALIALNAATTTACMTDAKDASCVFSDILVSGEDLYCPDPNAADDCDALNDAVVAAAVECSAGTFSEDELRAALDEGGALQQCDAARATSLSYDACLAHFTDPIERDPEVAQKCDGTSLGPVPDVCVGVILQGPAA